MKILVIGTGWTGKKVFEEIVSRKNIKVELVRHIEALPILHLYDVVVNCAGVTGVPNVDACELDKKGTIEGNAIYPVLLQKVCEDNNIRFAHFSSGCIYKGIIDDVSAEPNFFGSIYAVSKGISDSYLKDKSLLFRIRMPFTGIEEPKNYLSKIRYYAQHARLYDSGKNSLTDHNEAIRVACNLILGGAPYGAYNLVNKGSITMRELATLMKLEPKWFTESEFQRATRAERSTCVIPAYEDMQPLEEALAHALKL